MSIRLQMLANLKIISSTTNRLHKMEVLPTVEMGHAEKTGLYSISVLLWICVSVYVSLIYVAKSIWNFTSMLENTFLTRLIQSIKKPGIKEIYKETQVIRNHSMFINRERGNTIMITGFWSYYYMIVVVVAFYGNYTHKSSNMNSLCCGRE